MGVGFSEENKSPCCHLILGFKPYDSLWGKLSERKFGTILMQLQGPAPFWVCSKYRSIVANVLPPVVFIHSVQKTLKGEALFVYNNTIPLPCPNKIAFTHTYILSDSLSNFEPLQVSCSIFFEVRTFWGIIFCILGLPQGGNGMTNFQRCKMEQGSCQMLKLTTNPMWCCFG